MKVYKVVLESDGRLYSYNIKHKAEPGIAGLGDGVVSLLYEPGIATKPVIAGSGLYAFVDKEAAVRFVGQLVRMQVWECEAEFLGYIDNPLAGTGRLTHAAHIKFWREEGIRLFSVEQPASRSACLCSSITLKRRVQ